METPMQPIAQGEDAFKCKLPEGWEYYVNELGYPYYWNKEKQISQWEFPSSIQSSIPQSMFTPQPQTQQPQTQGTVMMQPMAPQNQPLYLPSLVNEAPTEDPQFKIEGNYEFTKEEGVTVKYTNHGLAVFGLETSDQCVAFIKKNKIKPLCFVYARGTHQTGTGKNRHTVTDLSWSFDLSDFLADQPSFENCDWDEYFESKRILKKVQVEKVIDCIENGGNPLLSLDKITNYIHGCIPWPKRSRSRNVHFELIKPRISIKPDNKTRACCSCTNCVFNCLPCIFPVCCAFWCYRSCIDKEMPHPKLRFSMVCSQEELQFHIANAIPKMTKKIGCHLKISPNTGAHVLGHKEQKELYRDPLNHKNIGVIV